MEIENECMYICSTLINKQKQSKMKNYLITFVTLDGNEQGVYVSATSKERAILKFESEYEFEAVESCEEDTAELEICE